MTDEDWRLQNLRQMEGATFVWRRFQARDPQWDHEHCIGCWDKIAEAGEPPEGQRTGLYHPESDNWVCLECYELFHQQLHWSISNTAAE